MNKKLLYMKKRSLVFICLLLLLSVFSQGVVSQTSEPINLIDDDLSYWFKWIGVPHTSVTDLPEGTPKGNGMIGTPLGLNDPKEVFKVVTLNGEKVIKVSGEIYGALTTKEDYSNYHLHLKYKWGEKKWAPRLNLPRDMGIMFHLTGTIEDAFWSVFMMGLEFQICENTTGAVFFVPNKKKSVFPCADIAVGVDGNWDKNGVQVQAGARKTIRSLNPSANYESDSSEWTTLDLYTVGSTAIYLVNGKVVMAYQNAELQDINKTPIAPLAEGKIQLQSEGAEGYYKDITMQKITDIPDDIRRAAGLERPKTWKFGLQGYCFRNYSFLEALERVDSTGLKYLEPFGWQKVGGEFKDSLLMELSPYGLEKLYNIVENRGIRVHTLYTFGSSIAEWKKQFEIAKSLHVKYLIGEPPSDLLDEIDSLAGSYGIKLAIHNHYEGTSEYWDPDIMLAAIKDRPNLMASPDVGHWPKSGIDSVEGLRKLEGHLVEIHLKDIPEANNTKVKDVVLGKGIVDFPEIFEELERQKFDGYLIMDRDAMDIPNNLNYLIESSKYYNKVINGM